MASKMQYPNGAAPAPGRTSSQISIHDYPEHLNPFHEDDNHKRIRFWRMSSNNAKKEGGRDRSNSFSLNGLKEMWAFKSFKLKKRSSTLGINKTSESPPMMRRHQLVHPVENESAMRHTVNVGYGTVSNSDGYSNFNRGVNYRSSLQNVHSTVGSESNTPDGSFFRNNRYRSTIQSGYQTTPNPRYNASPSAHGSVTPTPTRGYIQHGYSQTSLNSTNPFDDEDVSTNLNDDTVSRVTIGSFSTLGDGRRTYRKKRRAPPPPPPRTSSEPNHTSTSQVVIATVEETSREASTEDEKDLAEISNLAAQIESFVRTADTDADTTRSSSEDKLSKDTYTSAKPTKCAFTANEKPNEELTEDVRIQVNARHRTPDRFNATSRSSSSNSRASPENNDAYPLVRSDTSSFLNDKQINTLERTKPQITTQSTEIEPAAVETLEVVVRNVSGPRIEANSLLITESVEDLSNINPEANRDELKIANVASTISEPRMQPENSLLITESAEDLKSNNPQTPETTNDPSRYKIKFVAIKPASITPVLARKTPSFPNPTSPVVAHELQLDENHDYDNVIIRSNPTPQAIPKRRRSVKDIIESINKSQSLLRINQDPNSASLTIDKRVTSLEQIVPLQRSATANSLPSSQSYPTESNESIVRNLTELQASEAQMHEIINEMERSHGDDDNNNNHLHIDDQEVLKNIPTTVEQFSDFGREFKKCTVNYTNAATTSPLIAQRREKTNRAEWNPLPKPRRSRHLTAEADEGKI